MYRKVVSLYQVRQWAKENGTPYYMTDAEIDKAGIYDLVNIENMGFCKDDVTRFYMFDLDDTPCIYFKH